MPVILMVPPFNSLNTSNSYPVQSQHMVNIFLSLDSHRVIYMYIEKELHPQLPASPAGYHVGPEGII